MRARPRRQVVLGDWVFQSSAVEFGWAPGQRPSISIAARNPAYQLTTFNPARAGGWEPALASGRAGAPVQRQAVVRRVPLRSMQRLTFLVPASIGRPPQPMQLVFDTGSSFFGVRTSAPARPEVKEGSAAALVRQRAARADAERNLFKLSRALDARRPAGAAKQGPPWWAGALVALIGLGFFGLALMMAITRRRMQRGGTGKGGKSGSFLVVG